MPDITIDIGNNIQQIFLAHSILQTLKDTNRSLKCIGLMLIWSLSVDSPTSTWVFVSLFYSFKELELFINDSLHICESLSYHKFVEIYLFRFLVSRIINTLYYFLIILTQLNKFILFFSISRYNNTERNLLNSPFKLLHRYQHKYSFFKLLDRKVNAVQETRFPLQNELTGSWIIRTGVFCED